ncbi:MAG: phosphonoacetate hydrolase [Castellaniella sp.]
MTSPAHAGITVNGRHYHWPQQPTVVVCLDGSAPGYIEAAVDAGLAPNLRRIMHEGYCQTGRCVIPSFTNPNNLSIATGRPPSVHGISGNFHLDRDTGEAQMMNDVRFLRAPTLFQAFHAAGAGVAVVTAKDKLRALLGNGLDCRSGRAVIVSAEKADEATLDVNGVTALPEQLGLPLPPVYSAALSEFVFATGTRLLRNGMADLMYLSTTDYVQHKAAPGTPVANAFYAMFDRYVAQWLAMDCVLGITADHGMNAKHHPDGSPRVVWLQDVLDARLGAGRARVILPITDPYVAHHGALGSFATIYLAPDTNIEAVQAHLAALDGVDDALDNATACARFDLPADRVGDLVILGDRNTALGGAAHAHDLSGLDVPLRSHGGLAEQAVPVLVNRRIHRSAAHSLHNYDIFDLVLNHVHD